MATRRERVVLELEDRFSREMAKAAASTQLLSRELRQLDSVGNNVNLNFSSTFARNMGRIDSDARRAGSSINQLSGRLSLLAQSAAALGPALVPLTVAAVPAISGLTTGLGFAIAAGGTAVLAFQGVGDALETLNKAQLEPTEENLEKARAAMEELAPAAQALVMQLDDMGPAFKGVRDAAAEGLLPGVTNALDEVETLLPRVSAIVGAIGEATGDLVQAGAESLASDEWADFFDFIAAEARPTLMSLGESIGNITKGLAEMWIAFDPLTDDFTGGLLEASRAFESWAESLAETDGFQAFVRYIQETGPQVLDTLGAIGNMFLQIGEAAAPLGGPVLVILEAVADTISAIADSDLGTPIMAGVAALSAFNLLALATSKLGATAFGGFIGGQVKASAGLKTMRADLALMRAEYARLGPAAAVATSAMSGTTGAAKRMNTTLGGLGKSAALVGGLAIATTGAADGMGLTNTASLALMGTLAGPWGAAVGGGVGLMLDMGKASKESADAIDRWNAAMVANEGSLSGQLAALETARDEARDLADDGAWDDIRDALSFMGPDEGSEFTTEGKEAAALKELEEQAHRTRIAALGLSFALNEDISPSLQEMDRIIADATPALDHFGWTLDDLANAKGGQRSAMLDSIVEFMDHANSDAGRVEAVQLAFSGIADDAHDAAGEIDALTTAMDNLFNPSFNLAEARENFQSTLNTFAEGLDTKTVKRKRKDGGTFTEEVAGSRSLFDKNASGRLTEGVLQNREQVRSAAEEVRTLLNRMAESGRPAEELQGALRKGRQAIIDTGVAAGLNKEEIKDYLGELKLTPKTVNTILDADPKPGLKGIAKLKKALDDLNGKTYVSYLKTVRVAGVNSVGGLVQADGGFHPAGSPVVKAYANGGMDVANRHEPQIAPAGAMRIWAEPETQGESYIPHANDYRRPGAKNILAQTASLMGGRVEWYANGGLTANSVPVAAAGGSVSIDYDRLARSLAAVRQMYGDVHISGDPTVFRREMQKDADRSGRDMVRRVR